MLIRSDKGKTFHKSAEKSFCKSAEKRGCALIRTWALFKIYGKCINFNSDTIPIGCRTAELQLSCKLEQKFKLAIYLLSES